MKKYIVYLMALFVSIILVQCTDLEETPIDGVAADGGGENTPDFRAVLNEMNAIYAEWARQGGLKEMSGDAWAGPTRGGDWDDNAALRQIHTHTWAPDHVWLQATYNILLTGVFNADLLLADASQSADHPATKFLKSWFYYEMISLFGKVPYRESYDDLTQDALVYTRQEAYDIGVQLAEEALAELTETSGTGGHPDNIITKDAARMLLAKYLLNKAIYKSEYGTTEFTHDAADMTRVISLVNEMNATLNVGETDGSSYWKNFDVDNDESSEIILPLISILGGDARDISDTRWYYNSGAHYHMTPGGWNGPVIVGEYYEYFQDHGVAEGEDPRATYSRPDLVENLSTAADDGVAVGILRGQQYAPGGTMPLEDRLGNPLTFSEITELVITSQSTIERQGFRARKYVPDARNFDNPANDHVVYRFADAILMRAEAALRGGTGADAQVDLDAIRARVGLGSISASLENIYAERARELWLEGWRREDMIRFGTFLEAKTLKPTVSDTKYLLYAIPADALINPNMTQNPGY
jgi:hypothetical protein